MALFGIERNKGHLNLFFWQSPLVTNFCNLISVNIRWKILEKNLIFSDYWLKIIVSNYRIH
jgi:hypothetical protein